MLEYMRKLNRINADEAREAREQWARFGASLAHLPRPIVIALVGAICLALVLGPTLLIVGLSNLLR